jgi:hypothetical protein
MSKVLYFLTTFLESGLSVFGVHGTYEQPSYRTLQTLADNVEIRAYAPRTAAETPVSGDNQGEAFGRLFRYITGANTMHATVAMTVPVERTSQMIAMTVPVEISGETSTSDGVMRFFLPQSVVRAGVPEPTDRLVHIVSLPAETFGVIRYSGVATDAARARELAELRRALQRAGKQSSGPPAFFSYDPPFTIPFLRRNEVALRIVD